MVFAALSSCAIPNKQRKRSVRLENVAWSARCFMHCSDGRQCAKTLVMGETFTPDEAKHRIMEWCVRGKDIPDEPGARDRHMFSRKLDGSRDGPRDYSVAELRSIEALTHLAHQP